MEIIQLLMAALTALTALFAAYITWQQYHLGQRHFRHELYDRRLKVFQAARSFLSDIARDEKARFQRCVQFYAETSEAEFLFGNDIVTLVNDLYSRGLNLAELSEQLYPETGDPGLPVGAERTRIAKQRSGVLKNMTDDLGKIKQAFQPYLRIE